MENTGIFLVKDRSYYPKTRKRVKALFYFKSATQFFNVFFQRTIMNRLDETTNILFVNNTSHDAILSTWAASTDPDDTIFDNMLPYPNTKNYAWDCGALFDSILNIRNAHNHINRGGRPYFGPSIKQGMKAHLASVDHYTIEMLETTLDQHMKTNLLQFSHHFSMPKGMRASEISNTDYSNEMLSGNIIGAIEKFTLVSVISLPTNTISHSPTTPTHLPNPPTPPPPHPIGPNNVDVLSECSSDNEDDAEFEIKSSHATFINNDGTELPTSPYPIRSTKRRKEFHDSPILFPNLDNVFVTPNGKAPMSSMPLSRETSFNFCFSPAS